MPTLTSNRQNENWKGTKPKDPGGEKVEWWWWICLVIKPKLPSLALSSHPPNPPHPTIWLPPSLDKSDAARSPSRQYNGIPNFLWHLSIRSLRYCCSTYNVKVSLSCKVHWWHFLLLEKAQAKGKSRDNNLFASFGQIAFPAFGQIWSKILLRRYNRFHQSRLCPWINIRKQAFRIQENKHITFKEGG